MENTNHSVARRITERRERLGLSKIELAELASLSRDTVGSVEAGHGYHQRSLARIERALREVEQEMGAEPSTDWANPVPDETAAKLAAVLARSDLELPGCYHVLAAYCQAMSDQLRASETTREQS